MSADIRMSADIFIFYRSVTDWSLILSATFSILLFLDKYIGAVRGKQTFETT